VARNRLEKNRDFFKPLGSNKINELAVTNNKFKKKSLGWLQVVSGRVRPAGCQMDHAGVIETASTPTSLTGTSIK
jgi:hypothetical protein